MNDTHKKSHEEQIINQLTGYLVGVAINYIIFPPLGVDIGHAGNWAISLIYVAAAYVRGLVFRRFYNMLPYNGSFVQFVLNKVKQTLK